MEGAGERGIISWTQEGIGPRGPRQTGLRWVVGRELRRDAGVGSFARAVGSLRVPS